MKAGAVVVLLMLVSCDQLHPSKSTLGKKRQCAEAGRKWFEDQKRAMTPAANLIYDAPQFAYNQQLDTCLCYYQTMVMSSTERSHDQYVVDVLSNKTLLSYSVVNGKLFEGPPNFAEQKRDLMDQH